MSLTMFGYLNYSLQLLCKAKNNVTVTISIFLKNFCASGFAVNALQMINLKTLNLK
jgi:hypothetical protein